MRFLFVLVLCTIACGDIEVGFDAGPSTAGSVAVSQQASTPCVGTVNSNSGSAFSFNGSADLWVLRAFVMYEAGNYACVATPNTAGQTAQCDGGSFAKFYTIDYKGLDGSKRKYTIYNQFATRATVLMDPAYPAHVEVRYTGTNPLVYGCFVQPTVAQPWYSYCKHTYPC